MIVKLVLFAAVRDIVGQGSLEMQLENDTTVAELRGRLCADYPDAKSLIEKSAISVNHSYALDSTTIPDQSEVGVIPPVSGG